MTIIKNTIFESSKSIIGPVLFDYVCWTLQEARKRNIQRLYFLARDGYLLYKIAEKVKNAAGIHIDCRYLHCSRTALRLPSYHLIGDEAFELLLLGGYHLTRHTILNRIYIELDERIQIYKELGYTFEGEDDSLSYHEFTIFSQKLINNKTYRRCVIQKSKAAYPPAIGYLRQEGLLEINHIAIVDSGWTGTMQRSLRQLLSSIGYQGNITGFYFGLYKLLKKDIADGEYCSWYFNEDASALNKLLFSNNLFECFLSAPHGMTLAYERIKDCYNPILNAPPSNGMLSLIEIQIQAILQYTSERLNDFTFSAFDNKQAKRQAALLIRHLMVRPSRAKAEAYGSFAFCDDINEQNLIPLASEAQKRLLKENYLIFTRIYRKLTGLSKTYVNNDLFWPYGTASLLKNKYSIEWYRLNIFILDLLRWKLAK